MTDGQAPTLSRSRLTLDLYESFCFPGVSGYLWFTLELEINPASEKDLFPVFLVL